MNRPFVTINLLSFEHRVRWPDGVSSLDHYRTVAFETSLMREMIGFGWFGVNDAKRPWARASYGVILSDWVLLVPECYRARVGEIAMELFDKTLKGQLFKEWMREQFIKELRDALYEKLEPIMPGEES